MCPRLSFKHSFEVDKNAVWFILSNPAARALPNYLPNVGIDLMYELAKKGYSRLPKPVEKAMKAEIRKRYEHMKESNDQTMKKMETLWRPFERRFFARIERLFGKLRYASYVACVSPFSTLNSYFGSSNRILIESNIEWSRFRWTIAHELLHLFVYEKLKRYDISESERIMVGELAVEYILFEDPVLKQYWPGQTYVLWRESEELWGGLAPKRSLKLIKKKLGGNLEGRLDVFLNECIELVKSANARAKG